MSCHRLRWLFFIWRFSMKSKQFKPSTLSFHQEQCIHHLLDDASCHFCIDACPYQALTLNEGKIHIQSKLCQDCGRCVNTCPSSAFYLNHPINHYDAKAVISFIKIFCLKPLKRFLCLFRLK